MSYKITRDKADRVFSIYIRLRDGECLRCGSKVAYNDKGLPISHQASHFQGRRKEATRFSEYNVCTLCPACHMYLGSHPGEHHQFQVKRLGMASVNQIVLDSNSYYKKDREAEYLFWRQKVFDDFGLRVK